MMKVKLTERSCKNGSILILSWFENGLRKKKSTGLVVLNGSSKEIKDANKKIYLQAEKQRMDLELELAEGKTTVKIPSLLEYWSIVVKRRKASGITYNTCRTWNESLAYVKKFLRSKGKVDIKLDMISVSFVEDFKGYLVSFDLRPRTVNLYLEKFLAVLKSAVKEDYIKNSIAESVKYLKYERQSVVYLTTEEVKLLFENDYPTKMEICLATRFSLLTALRISDVANLKWSNVKEDFIELVTIKNHARLRLPITEKMRIVLNRAKELWPDSKETVFGPLRAKSYDKSFKSWGRRLGIEKKLRWHLFRDTAANLMLQNGVDIFTVSKVLTHCNVHVTQSAYVTDATDEMFSNALKKL